MGILLDMKRKALGQKQCEYGYMLAQSCFNRKKLFLENDDRQMLRFVGRRNIHVLADFTHNVRLDFRMARHRCLAGAIAIRVNGVISALAQKLAAISMQVLEQLRSLHAGTG